MRYLLSVNGIDNAFPREFGCACARCRRPDRGGQGDGFGWTAGEWRANAKQTWESRQITGTVDVPAIGSRWLL
jgi:hypothetical protein